MTSAPPRIAASTSAPLLGCSAFYRYCDREVQEMARNSQFAMHGLDSEERVCDHKKHGDTVWQEKRSAKAVNWFPVQGERRIPPAASRSQCISIPASSLHSDV